MVEKATHTSYTLVPRWIRGLPGVSFSVAISASDAMHVASTAARSVVLATPRYGVTVQLFGILFGGYVEGRARMVSSLEMALAEGMPTNAVATPPEKAKSESAPHSSAGQEPSR